MTAWYEGPLSALTVRSLEPRPLPPGTERRRPDPERDRITDASFVTQQNSNTPLDMHSWAIGTGTPAGPAVEALARALTASTAAGRPLVVAHAPYDLTLLDRELRRHRHTPLAGYLGTRTLCVLDPVLLDGRLNRGAPPRARRTLAQLCDDYGVSAPHSPTGPPEDDAVAVLKLVRALGRRFAPRLAGLTPGALHTRQAVWYAAAARGHATWFSPSGPRSGVDPAWPLRPAAVASAGPNTEDRPVS